MISNKCLRNIDLFLKKLNSSSIFKFLFYKEVSFLFNLFIAKSNVGTQNKKASMMFLSKEASNKDQQLKTQMLVSFQDDESRNTENVWQESGFFDDHRSDLTIPKANFPENTLVYVNQGTVSLVKGGDQAIYLKFVVIGQLMPVANPDP